MRGRSGTSKLRTRTIHGQSGPKERAPHFYVVEKLAPQVGLEPTTLRLTAGCSAIELLRSVTVRLAPLATRFIISPARWCENLPRVKETGEQVEDEASAFQLADLVT